MTGLVWRFFTGEKFNARGVGNKSHFPNKKKQKRRNKKQERRKKEEKKPGHSKIIE